jgi:hypothetical protein
LTLIVFFQLVCVPAADGSARLSEAVLDVAADLNTAVRRVGVAVRAAQGTVRSTIPAFLREVSRLGVAPVAEHAPDTTHTGG